MRIVHTADLHLKKDDRARLAVLEKLVKKINDLKAGLLIIAGDLFDSDADASFLRPVVRDMFETSAAPVLVIPGNHDRQSFGAGADYGRRVIAAGRRPVEIHEFEGLRIAAVPYQPVNFGGCVRDLPSDVDIIIAHGTLLDAALFFARPVDEAEYMPILPGNLEGLCRYAALGHFHARPVKTQYKNTHVAYPGSLIALDTKCDVERGAFVIDIDKKNFSVNTLQFKELAYWQHGDFFAVPGTEEKIFADIGSFVERLDPGRNMPDIRIRGFTSHGDREFNNRLKAVGEHLRSRFADYRLDAAAVRSWGIIAENRMVRRFVEKTAGLDDALRLRMFEIVFPVFAELIK